MRWICLTREQTWRLIFGAFNVIYLHDIGYTEDQLSSLFFFFPRLVTSYYTILFPFQHKKNSDPRWTRHRHSDWNGEWRHIHSFTTAAVACCPCGYPSRPNTSFICWTTGNSGAGVPHQKMASLVEAIHFELSGMISTWLRANMKRNIFLQPCNFEKIMP